MPYVFRDEDGKINGVYSRPYDDRENEFLEDDNPELIAFRNPPPPLKDRLYALINAKPVAFRSKFVTIGIPLDRGDIELVKYIISQSDAATTDKNKLLAEFDK